MITHVRVRSGLWLAVTLFLMCCSGTSRAQRPQEAPEPLSADEVIQILQANPDLLAEAKAQIVAQAQERGYTVTEPEITDERLFSQIRSDDRVRLTLSDELKRRGFGSQQEGPELESKTVTGVAQKPTSGQKADRVIEANTGKERTSKNNELVRKEKTMSTGPKSPYENLPALQDLYAQTSTNSEKLERFGAALFRNSSISIAKAALDMPVGLDYVVGPGDELIVQYWGSASGRLQLVVDREGRIALPESGTILVTGRTLGQVQQLVQEAMSHEFKRASVEVSLGRLRTLRVYVVGDVKNPGAYDISSLSSVLSALLAAGGPTDTGSLRTVKHFRGKKLIEEIDLYELMLHGLSSGEGRIEAGDNILVPPAGPQVTIAGTVRRPAIYELRNEHTLFEALDLAGGVLVTGEIARIKVESIEQYQGKVMLTVNLPKGGDIQAMQEALRKVGIKDGDRVTVDPILPYTGKAVYLEGHVFRPGKYPFREGLRVSDVLGSYADLLPEPADRAEIVRLSPPDFRPTVIGFNLRNILEGREEAPALQPFDTLRVLGRYETDAPKVSIYGEVLRPGEYPLSQGMTAADLLRLSGGFKRSAYIKSADLSSYGVISGERVVIDHKEVSLGSVVAGDVNADVVLKPGDSLAVRQLGGWNDIGSAITVAGEVLHPGRYGIQEGDRLSTIVRRAGGFTAAAYPNGVFLERSQVRELSAKSRDELVRKLETQSVESSGVVGKVDPVAAHQRQELIDKLKQIQPNGRLLVHISPQVSKWENTGSDIEVRAGDRLTVPKQPNFVLVAGQVYNPTAISFTRGRNASWYLRQAGGATVGANKKYIFVVRANGSVVGRASGQWWPGNVLNTVLLPGDTVYVPEKISGSSNFQILSQTAQLLSGLALTARVITTF